ncbi:hypothetical protein IFM89_000493 [Coptis chinensis]|uniref:Uncharacterized protein n=1 Tax=Coptis chinensis TaxID=261450 RepID=A0A835LCZ3_9MAGN|nr:hypothetical protein IFM89_000493 [Coptis chinensis]
MNSIICISHSFTILLVLLQAFESSPIMSSATPSPARSMEQTATWAVAAVCFVMVAISIFLEYILHVIGKWLQKKHKLALYEALEKVKAELMLLGFISLLLTIAKGPISSICVPISVGDTWLPCSNGEKYEKAKKTDGYTDKCLDKARNHDHTLPSIC